MEYHPVSDCFCKGKQVNRCFTIKIRVARKDFNEQLCLIRYIIDHLLLKMLSSELNPLIKTINMFQEIWLYLAFLGLFIFEKWPLKKPLENAVERKWPEMNLWYLSGGILNLENNYLLQSAKIIVMIPPRLSSYKAIFKPFWWIMPFR